MKTYNILSIEEFKTNIGNNSRLLGIDPGNKNIGFAICDENKKVATPLKIIKKIKFEILFKFSINFIIDVKSLDKLSTLFSSNEILANFDMCFTVSLSIDICDYRQISMENSI